MREAPVRVPSPDLSPTASARSIRDKADPIVRALRVKQWTKNLLVLAAPGAAGVLLARHALTREAAAFVTFCLVASAGYLLNDVVDVVGDRAHPRKRDRPVASGALSQRIALVGACVLATAGLALSDSLGVRFLMAVLAYLVVTVAYSLGLKRVAVVDLFLVASCYVIRAVAGGTAVSVAPSEWFLILTTSSALAVVAGKRSADLIATGEDEVDAGGDRYTGSFLTAVWLLTGAVALVSYCLWAFNVPHTVDGIAWSQVSIVPFAIAFLRYIYLIDRGAAGSPEDVLFHDRVFQFAVVCWLGVYAWGVYSR